jgi:dTDP-4-dehydrorhamnose reductase
MKALLLGKRSLVAKALFPHLTNLVWLSFDEVKDKSVSFFNEFSHIFNCIAYTQVDKAEEEKEAAFAINAIFPEKLASSRCKLIHYSTDYVFDGNSTKVYNEDAFASPLSVYGQTKLEGEKRILNKNKEALIIRTSWVYGQGKMNFAEAVLNNMMQKEEVRVTSDQFNKTTSSHDLAEATMHLLDQVGIFHFANEGVLNRFVFAEEILTLAKQCGFDLNCQQLVATSSMEFNPKAKRPIFSALSTEKYERVTGQRVRNYKEPLEEYVKALRGVACY